MRWNGDVKLDCVSSTSYVRPVMLIPDLWVVSKLHGPEKRMNDLPDTPKTRKMIRFFEVASYKYTSIAEQVCV